MNTTIFRSFLCAGMAALFAAATPAVADQEALRAFVAKKAGVLRLLHSKAERALVTAAQDRTFSQYFEAQSEEKKSSLRERIDQISLAVQRKFAVEEMCLINHHGAEISRIVGNEIAYDLATDEADAIFFEPAFEQAPRTVYTSPIYVSADALRWVMAYVTPIVAGGEKQAILHYEHGLDYYQDTLNADVDRQGPRALLAVTEDGWIVSDSRSDIAIEQVGDSEDPADYFKPFSLDGMSLSDMKAKFGSGTDSPAGGPLTIDGRPFDVAYATFGDWTLVAFEPQQDEVN